jgi:hypothetical protein
MLQPLNREYNAQRQDRKHARPEPEIARPHFRVVQYLEDKLKNHRGRNRYNYRLPFNQQPMFIPSLTIHSLSQLEEREEKGWARRDLHVYTKNTNPSRPPPSFSAALATTPQQPRTESHIRPQC